MFNKLIKHQKKVFENLESTKLVKQIQELVVKQGGYTKEQESKVIELQREHNEKMEQLRVESLKKNLELLK